ncbi:MAG: hypothetical protein JXQ73_08265 [Phycisphaerae bacterium]|nr:hypothetical protein [Phycisphaerae bacterium]
MHGGLRSRQARPRFCSVLGIAASVLMALGALAVAAQSSGGPRKAPARPAQPSAKKAAPKGQPAPKEGTRKPPPKARKQLVAPAKKAPTTKAEAEEPEEEPAEAKKPEAPKEEEEEVDASQIPTKPVRDLFADFLHFVKIGKFRIANSFAAALLRHPEAQPVRLLALSEEFPDSVEILTIILSNSAVGQNAREVLERINEGRRERRRDPKRIKDDISLLGGDPGQVLNATQRLQWSGEYAVPWMIAALGDPKQKDLHPRILKALPKLGLRAVTPLAMALRTDNDVVKLEVIEALALLGYPHALPYLKQVAEDKNAGQNIRDAALAAMMRIDRTGASGRPAAVLFYQLADQYYANNSSVRADPRENESNIWYWRDGWVKADRVPREIFDEIMTMRCCEEALRLQPDQAESEALWLAANFRREAQLGVASVVSEEPDKALAKDVTKPEGYPRSIYFARSAGPRFNHMVLARALKDHDAAVALGAITALAETAGESSLIGSEDIKQPLVEALAFTDAVVRIRAALALGRALPKTKFAGSQEVIPVLAQALSLTGQRSVVVVDPDDKNLNRVMGILRDADCRVVGETSFPKAMARARQELPTLDACFLASDLSEPDLRAALDELRGQPGGKNLPVVILAKERQMAMTERILQDDQAAGRVLAVQGADRILAEWDVVNRRVGRLALNPDVALGLAISSAETLRLVAASHSPVFDVGRAEPALVAALKHDEADLRILSAEALAMIPTEAAQRAVAAQALDAGNDGELRIAMFSSLAESGRHHGNKLAEDQVAALIKIVMDEKDLPIRTAASQAFGALNIPGNRASEIIRAQYRG